MSQKVKVSVLLFVVFAGGFCLCGCSVVERVFGTEKSWQFAVTGDSRSSGENNGVNVEILSELAVEIAKRDVDFVLFPGDLVVGSENEENLESQLLTWRGVMQPVYNAGIEVYAVRGNHDIGWSDEANGMEVWDRIFSGRYALPENGPEGEKKVTYSVVHKNALLVGLDQYQIKTNQLNQDWLDEQLAANTRPHVFVYGHVPAFKAAHKDCLGDYPDKRDTFIKSLEDAGARVYFCGHDHFYNHAAVDNDGDPDNDIHQFIVGTAGAPAREFSYDGDNGDYEIRNVGNAKQFGYVLGTVEGDKVTLVWMQRVARNKFSPAETWSYSVGK